MTTFQVKNIPIFEVCPYARNPRKNSAAVDRVAASIREFGFRQPLVVDENMTIIAGHTRLEAARKLGLETVPVHIAEGLGETKKKAYRIADNRTSELSSWDDDLLALELEDLQETDFDMEVTGFDSVDIDALLDGGKTEGLTDPDEVPEERDDAVSKPGDVWVLGRHRVMCGDSTSAGDVAALMNGEKADLCFTSPPYAQQRAYTEESKEYIDDWDELMRGVFGNLPMSESGQVFVNLGLVHKNKEWFPYWDSWIQWMRDQGWLRFGFYVWDQGAGLPGDWNGRLSPSHEFVFHFNKKPMKPKKVRECLHAGVIPVSIGMRGYDGVASKKKVAAPVQSHAIYNSVIRVNRQGSPYCAGGHPAPFPVGLPEIFIQSWNGIVYEPFSGSGTTIIAAEKNGIICHAMEISHKYVDISVRRWQNFTGEPAVLERTGELFDGPS